MFYLPRTSPSAWGANSKGSPLIASTSTVEPLTVFLLPVSKVVRRNGRVDGH